MLKNIQKFQSFINRLNDCQLIMSIQEMGPRRPEGRKNILVAVVMPI